MPLLRLPLFLFLFTFMTLGLGSCSEEDPEPAISYSQQLTTGSWRLDAIQISGQATSSGTAIKDRYSLTFRPDGTYIENQFVNGSTYNGTWMLMGSNTILHFTDHKGANHEFILTKLTASEMRYHWTNKENKQEEYVFTAQP
ncbi:lipocalin family protein [uncultured Hymenobacter sp.]|uniref:lipocalin family protein n=1 Tax=uncultured Hymenobacter sp. TaxID=170016 RepID=UPI0035CA4AA0